MNADFEKSEEVDNLTEPGGRGTCHISNCGGELPKPGSPDSAKMMSEAEGDSAMSQVSGGDFFHQHTNNPELITPRLILSI